MSTSRRIRSLVSFVLVSAPEWDETVSEGNFLFFMNLYFFNDIHMHEAIMLQMYRMKSEKIPRETADT